MYEFLKDYKPQKVTDGGGPFKCNKQAAVPTYARIEEYDGDKDEWKGVKFFRYELTMADGSMGSDAQALEGRKLWKSVDLRDEAKMKKLADMLFTVGLEFTDEDSLLKSAEEFVEMTLEVSAWIWSPEGEDKLIQLHKITGKAENKGEVASSSVPF